MVVRHALLVATLSACTTNTTEIIDVAPDSAAPHDAATDTSSTMDAPVQDASEETAADVGPESADDAPAGPSSCCCDGLDPARFVVTCGCFVDDPTVCGTGGLGPCWAYQDAGHPTSTCGGPGLWCCSEPPHACGCTYARDYGPSCDDAAAAIPVSQCP